MSAHFLTFNKENYLKRLPGQDIFSAQNFSSYIFITYTCKYHVFNCFFCIIRNIFLSTFTFKNSSEIKSFCLTSDTGCKISERFIEILIQAYQFCSFDTSCYFYDCYLLHQFSCITFRLSHQLRIICCHEITKFVMRTLKQLCACILAAYVRTKFECLPPANESKPCFLANPLVHSWPNQLKFIWHCYTF